MFRATQTESHTLQEWSFSTINRLPRCCCLEPGSAASGPTAGRLTVQEQHLRRIHADAQLRRGLSHRVRKHSLNKPLLPILSRAPLIDYIGPVVGSKALEHTNSQTHGIMGLHTFSSTLIFFWSNSVNRRSIKITKNQYSDFS